MFFNLNLNVNLYVRGVHALHTKCCLQDPSVTVVYFCHTLSMAIFHYSAAICFVFFLKKICVGPFSDESLAETETKIPSVVCIEQTTAPHCGRFSMKPDNFHLLTVKHQYIKPKL